MKACMVMFLLSCLISVRAQSGPPQPSTGQQTGKPLTAATPAPSPGQLKIDPAKEADIRRLLELTGAAAAITQAMDGAEKSIKPLMTNAFPPGEYREKLIDLFFAKFRSKFDVHTAMDLAVPVYDKYLSHDEIKGLIQFYETPLGQKALDVMPRASGELREQGTKLGETIGRDSMVEVLAEHPDLAKAFDDAKKAAQPK
jgi:hypothetical protein